MERKNEPDLTPVQEERDVAWCIGVEKLFDLRYELHNQIMAEGLAKVSDEVNINPLRLYHLVDLPNTHRTRKTLIKLCDYFNIGVSTYATRIDIWV